MREGGSIDLTIALIGRAVAKNKRMACEAVDDAEAQKSSNGFADRLLIT